MYLYVIFMYLYVSLCIFMSSLCHFYVSLCIFMYLYVSLCIFMYFYVSLCIFMYLYVSLCIFMSSLCIFMYLYVIFMYLYVSCAFDINTFSTYVDMAELFWWVTKGFLEKQDQGSPDLLVKDQGSGFSRKPLPRATFPFEIYWPQVWLFILITIIEEPRYQSVPCICLPFGKKVPSSNVRTYGKGIFNLYVFFTKMASLKETRDFNSLSYDIDLINDDVFLLLYPSYFSQNLDLPYRTICNSNHKQNNTDKKLR